MAKLKSVGSCKHCFKLVGYSSSGQLVHVLREKASCTGVDSGKFKGSKVAELRVHF